MQLVLVKKRLVSFQERSDKCYGASLEIHKDEVTWSEGSDAVTKSLLDNLFPGVVNLNVKLWKVSRPSASTSSTWNVEVQEGHHSLFLRNLRKRFYKNVSLVLEVGAEEEKDLSSTEEMEIREWDTDTMLVWLPQCSGSVKFDMNPVEATMITDHEESCDSDVSTEEEDANQNQSRNETFEKKVTQKGIDLLLTLTAKIPLSDAEILASADVDGPIVKKIFEGALGSDVIISAKDGVTIKGHKCFLQACSPTLGTASDIGELEMTDVSEKGVRAFLQYVYYRNLPHPKDLDVAYELLYLAKKYDIFPLEAWAISHLLDKKDENYTAAFAYKVYGLVQDMKNGAKLKCKTLGVLVKKLMVEHPEYAKQFLDKFKVVDDDDDQPSEDEMSGDGDGPSSKKRKLSA